MRILCRIGRNFILYFVAYCGNFYKSFDENVKFCQPRCARVYATQCTRYAVPGVGSREGKHHTWALTTLIPMSHVCEGKGAGPLPNAALVVVEHERRLYHVGERALGSLF